MYSSPTHDKHQWLLLQLKVILKMDAKDVRNMYSILVVFNKHNTARVASCLFIIYYKNKLVLVVCGSKMPTRCNRGFYCRSYCLLNMFRAPLCPKHVEQAIRSAIKSSVASSWHFIFTY